MSQSQSSTTANAASSGIEKYLLWFSRICGAISVFSLLNHAFNFGIADALAPLIAAWQLVVHYAVGWILLSLGFPAIWGDFFVLSTVTIFVFYRGALRLGIKPFQSGFTGIRTAYVKRSVAILTTELHGSTVYGVENIADIEDFFKRRMTEKRFKDLNEDEKKLVRRLRASEFISMIETERKEASETIDSGATLLVAAAAASVPVLFGLLFIAMLVLQIIGPFVFPTRYNYDLNVLVSAAKSVPYTFLISYFFAPLLAWATFVFVYLRGVVTKIDTKKSALGSFPRLVFDETLVLIAAVAVFFVTNAGFSIF